MVSNDDSLVSDVQNIDTIDLNNYYIGCDSRISLSDTVSKEMVKYWINVQNDFIVQRYLSLIGSAAIGYVLIEYSPTDAIKYGCGLNGAPDTYKNILKTISSSQLDYSENNATINGWIIDFLKNQDNIQDTFITALGGAETDKTYDGQITTHGYFASRNPNYVEVMRIDLGSLKSISSIHYLLRLKNEHSSGHTSFARIQISDDGSTWETLSTDSQSGDVYVDYPHIITAHTTNPFRYFRMQLDHSYSSTAVEARSQIVDISMYL